MRKNYFSKKVLQACVLFFMIITTNVFAQVGIGTITPHASSVLDVSSTTQGMLTPRMTTVQRAAIGSPADGLMVYDTDLKSFYHYNSTLTSWNVINSGTTGRLKFKRIKSTDVLATVLATEKAAGGNTKYLLDVNTYYEINGTISFDLPIDLNNAYISGQDANEDVLVRTSGNLFDGTTGGSIRNVTIQVPGGKVFNLSGAATQSLIIRDTVIAGSQSVGSITGFGLVFVSIVQYVGNATGIVYDNISKLLISNAAWFSNNGGTYEKLQGTFGLVQKQGGFTEVSGTAIGFDVSSNPTITGDAVMELVVFTGAVSGAGAYVKPYTSGSYTGYNFNNGWSVRCAGIPNEGDSFATGNLYLNRALTSPTIQLADTGSAYKIPGTTISTNLFRMNGSTSNRLVYSGKKARTFTATATVSFEGGSGATDVLFYFVKFSSTGVPTFITSSETFIDSNTANVQSFSVSGTITLANGEYVELYAQRLNGTNKTFTFRSYNMSIK